MATFDLTVQGMTCNHCEKAVKETIKAVDIQATVEIKRVDNHVVVDTTHAIENILAALAEEGYPAFQRH